MDNQPLLFDDEDLGFERYPTAFLSPDPDAPHLNRVEIQAFKGIRDLKIELPKLSILTGPNNSGKSAILQAIVTGFECFRLCLDTDRWRLREGGRALKEFDFLPVNQPRDLWYQTRTRKPREPNEQRPKEQYVRISLYFTNDFSFTAEIRFLYGFLNAGVTNVSGSTTESMLRQIASSAPLLIPGIPAISAHEPFVTSAVFHREANFGHLSQIIRNVLWNIQQTESGQPSDKSSKGHLIADRGLYFVRQAIRRHFGVDLLAIDFDESRDLELRAPYQEGDYQLDIVSAGSGLAQILQLVSFLVWRKSRIILLDEPDSHLHASLQLRLYSFLKEISDSMNLQMILATHSRDLISQAPMEAIIPVDTRKSELCPIQSIEHLLVEFARYGPITNPDLALLYRSKRRLFVEGNDKEYLPAFAQVLEAGCFEGQDPIVIFPFGGAGKFTMVSDLARLFERMVGASIRWAVLRDRDYATPRVLSKYKEQATCKGIKTFHIWEKFCIENYLLEPGHLHNAVSKKLTGTGGAPVTVDQIVTLLEETCNDLLEETRTEYVTQTQTVYRRLDLEIAEQASQVGTKDALAFWDDVVKDLPSRLANLPGDKVFGRFVQRLQDKFGVNIRAQEVISEMSPDTVADEVKQFFQMLENL